jgi:hypothetical protein
MENAEFTMEYLKTSILMNLIRDTNCMIQAL